MLCFSGICGSNAWALGVTYGFLHGQEVWLVCFILALVIAALATQLTPQKSWEDDDECDVVETAGESAIVV